jgi:hypothetical protein
LPEEADLNSQELAAAEATCQSNASDPDFAKAIEAEKADRDSGLEPWAPRPEASRPE